MELLRILLYIRCTSMDHVMGSQLLFVQGCTLHGENENLNAEGLERENRCLLVNGYDLRASR